MFTEVGHQTYIIKVFVKQKSREGVICRELLHGKKVLTCTVPVYRDFKKNIGKCLLET
jgi:hypothetical protein